MALLVLLSVGMLIVGFGAFGVIGVITPISRDLALSPVGAGWIISAYAFAYAIGSPLGASITGRLDRRTVLVIGMGMGAAGALLTATATNPPVLCPLTSSQSTPSSLVTTSMAASRSASSSSMSWMSHGS